MKKSQTGTITTQTTDFSSLPSREIINETIKSLKEKGFLPHDVKTKEQALEKVKSLIPTGSTIMNGSSTTLSEIGFIEYLKDGKHSWTNLHDAILAEEDENKQSLLRRKSVVSDYYLGSVHAVTQDGEILVASNSGSQLPHLVYTSPNIVLVVGAQKIVSSLTEAFNRLNEYVIDLENARMQKAYGMNTDHGKTIVLHKENPYFGRKVHVIIVEEKLGF